MKPKRKSVIQYVLVLMIVLALPPIVCSFPSSSLGTPPRKLLLPVLTLEARASKTKVTKLELSNQTQDILSGMSEKDKELVRKTKGGDLIMFHHGWGTGIRNISF